MHIAATHTNGFDVAVTSDDLRTFAASWPCFGVQTSPVNWRGAALLFSFDRKGDLIDLQGDEGLDEQGVAALCADAKAHAINVYELPA